MASNITAHGLLSSPAEFSMQYLWQEAYTQYAGRPALLEYFLIQITQILFFWIPSTILLLLDVLFPKWSNSHKIQSERFQPSRAQIKHCIQHVVTNNVVGAVLPLIVAGLSNFQNPIYLVTPVLPTSREVMTDVVIAMFARELLFYTSHRTLHHPKLYKRFHKQHHYFIAPMAFASQYAHPVEHVIANVIPVILPLAVRKAHILTFCVYLGWAVLEPACVHSGYDFFVFPILGTMHDLHHEKFNVNFGGMGWLDYVCGTARWHRDRKADEAVVNASDAKKKL